MSEARKIHALLVEDDDEDALIMERRLGHVEGYQVALARAGNVDAAGKMVPGGGFDLIFLDLNVGAPLTGMSFLKEIHAKGNITPVVVVTGSGDISQAVEAMKNGAYDYLVKGALTPDLVERTIRAVTQRHTLEKERDEAIAQLAEMSFTDALTGIANRRRFISRLEEECARSARSGQIFALLMLDLDHFKQINDKYGHQVGDCVLQKCAEALRKNARSTDLLARYGGEEFCIVLPETSLDGARFVAEKIRRMVKSLPPPIVTASVGVAQWNSGCNSDELLQRSDRALYEAKSRGRDCVVIFNPLGAPSAPRAS